MGTSKTLDQVWDTIDDVVDAAGRVAARLRTTLANANRVAAEYRSASVPASSPRAAVENAEIIEDRAVGSRWFMAKRSDAEYIITDGKSASATCSSRALAAQLLKLVRELERDERAA